MKNSTNDTQAPRNNDEIANAYDHLTPPDYPIAYRARKWFFCGLPFFVNKHALVPRADTEVLVSVVTSQIETLSSPRILDMCTGSGCIAVALAKKGICHLTASDISGKALKIAKRNARFNKAKIKFRKSNLFEKINSVFDIITCNPPYIKTAEIGKYDKSILCEPRIALDGGADGLDFYRRLIVEAPQHLKADGVLAMEFGNKLQGEEIKSLLQAAGYGAITIVKDRVIYARKA